MEMKMEKGDRSGYDDCEYELEAKVEVDNLDVLEAKLKSLGAELVGRWRETDRFFDFPDQRLKKADSALRLRERADQAGTNDQWTLTFKGPKHPGRFKYRRELELKLNAEQPHTVEAILTAIGAEEFISYIKHRRTLNYRDCVIELDELEGIGRFIEVEGPNEETIEQVLADLDLHQAPTITRSYLAMIIDYRSSGGVSPPS